MDGSCGTMWVVLIIIALSFVSTSTEKRIVVSPSGGTYREKLNFPSGGATTFGRDWWAMNRLPIFPRIGRIPGFKVESRPFGWLNNKKRVQEKWLTC